MAKIFHKNAIKVLDEFDKIMRDNGFVYYLMWGSLLGAIREHGFISHDFDIDIAIWNDQDSDAIRNALELNGFKMMHDQVVDGGKSARHQLYVKEDVGIDFFWFYPPINRLPYTCSYEPMPGAVDGDESRKKFGGVMPIRVEIPFNKEVRFVQFENLNLPIPTNAEEIVRILYGEDYMIPNPDWVDNTHDKYHIRWSGKIAVFNEL